MVRLLGLLSPCDPDIQFLQENRPVSMRCDHTDFDIIGYMLKVLIVY